MALSGIARIVGETTNFRNQIGGPQPPLTGFGKRGPNRL
jgi:hypothetical protein